MGKNYYGTVTALAWAVGHYFYQAKHFVFLAGEYFPYRLRNPKSSNPHLIYQDIYQAWKDRDDHDKFINQHRLGITAGVIKKELEGVIDSETSSAVAYSGTVEIDTASQRNSSKAGRWLTVE